MVKLVDTPASGAGARKGVEVQVLFWAPNPILLITPTPIFTGYQLPWGMPVISLQSQPSRYRRPVNRTSYRWRLADRGSSRQCRFFVLIWREDSRMELGERRTMSTQADIERCDSRPVTKKVWTTPVVSTLGLSQTASGTIFPGGENFVMFLAPCDPGQMTLGCS